MKNLLVTGGSGFIGSNFIRYVFTQTNYGGKIVNLDKLTYAGNPENLIDIEKNYKDRYVFEQVDLCNNADVKNVFEKHGIDAVCHFAAESHVDRSIAGPVDFIQTNIIGTFNLLEAARSIGEHFVLFHHVSTDEVYGSLGKDGFFTETTPYHPNSPYSASKAGSDHLVNAYHHTYGLPVTLSNCSNNYGPYQFPEKLIPLMILNGLSGSPLPVYGEGLNVRDWLYVEDHCRAVWLVMTNGIHGESYNIGGNNEMKNIDVVNILCDILDEMSFDQKIGSRRKLITFVKDRPGHDLRYAIDYTKIRNELGFEPKESFETGIRKTVKWYMDNRAWIKNVQSGEYRRWLASHYS